MMRKEREHAMGDFVINGKVLNQYLGNEKVVVVPDGVTCIGSEVYSPTQKYRPFYCNQVVEEIYLPDSVTKIAFKALEHCASLKVLAFSNKLAEIGCNAINGCTALRTIIYRGTIFEFSCMDFTGQTPDLETVYCTDGKIQFGEEREYYIETLYFPETREEWDRKYGTNDWRNRRCRNIVCIGDKQPFLFPF